VTNRKTIVLVEQLADGWMKIDTGRGTAFHVPPERVGDCLREILADPNLPEPKLEPVDPHREMVTALAENLAGPRYGNIARSATPVVMEFLNSAIKLYASAPAVSPPGYTPPSPPPPPQPSASKPPPRRPHRSY
jgi:hypothetical protein